MRLDPKIEFMLREAEVPWSVRRGKRHNLLVVGEEVVLAFPMGRVRERRSAVDNARAEVRRYLRERDQ